MAKVHESHPLPDLLTLLEKLPEEPWVKKEREAGDAFQAGHGWNMLGR